jgi:zinc ribbon protein
MSPLLRRRRSSDGIALDGLKARRPHAGLLRRERRALLKARADALTELGGLLVEMYRRGSFRDDLLAERAASIVGIDGRLAEIEALLHTGRKIPRCECGAPVLRGSRFCPNCGRPLGTVERSPGPREDVSEETVIEPAPRQ